MDLKRDLETEMAKDVIVIAYLKDHEIATDFYRALCNVDWLAPKNLSDEEMIIERLKGNTKDIYSCSWRYAGGIIAGIRNANYNLSENYMNFYCAGFEGTISPLVRDCFQRMGWIPVTYYG